MSERISLRLPVAGEVFFLDIPFYRTMLHALWLPEITIRQGQVEGSRCLHEIIDVLPDNGSDKKIRYNPAVKSHRSTS